jgi:anti-sigma B factor antagonist
MNVHVEQRDGTVILQPDGDVDLASSPALRSSLQETQVEQGGRMVIDLSHVQYMDSSGVATLVECLQRTRNAGIELHLCQLNERVLSVFQIARLDGVFSIVGTIDDAMTA